MRFAFVKLIWVKEQAATFFSDFQLCQFVSQSPLCPACSGWPVLRWLDTSVVIVLDPNKRTHGNSFCPIALVGPHQLPDAHGRFCQFVFGGQFAHGAVGA
jgi:hypothetical protein